MDEMSNEELVLAYRLLNKDLALEVFEGLDQNDQQKLISSLTERDAVAVFAELAPDDRVRLLDELPAGVAKRMIASLNREDRAEINLLMGFEPETAGRWMTPDFVRLPSNWTAGHALQQLRTFAKNKETIYTMFVTNQYRKLKGVLGLRELLIADEDTLVGDLMETEFASFTTDTDQEELAKSMQTLELLAAPIVDKENRLIGIVTIDDAMDILQDEATEDILNSAGLAGRDVTESETTRSATLVEGSYLKIWKARLPFLFITLAAGTLSGSVIGSFEDTLSMVPIIAMFIPVIMDMGGTIGTQSSTIFTRGMLLGHIKMTSIWKHVLKEIGVGISLGIIMGTLTGIVAYLFSGMAALGLAVGISLIFAMTLASALGFIIPFTLYKLKIDQATGTGPLITSIKDITGLTIYFLLASALLSHLM
jgi:magnesium transporter